MPDSTEDYRLKQLKFKTNLLKMQFFRKFFSGYLIGLFRLNCDFCDFSDAHDASMAASMTLT
jgi:hypothetical protein